MSKRICLLVSSLSSGGAEKVAANMSLALHKRGYEVTVFSMQNNIDYKYEGVLYNFGLDKEKYGKFKAFFKLKQYFKENQFDIIIDHRLRDRYFKEVLFSKLIFNKKTIIYCIHNYRLEYYFSFLKKPWLTKHQHVRKATFVSVCKEIEKHVNKTLKIASTTIYNFIDFKKVYSNKTNENLPKNYIIGVGRLTNIKQFDVLIKSYKKSHLICQNIKLVILGSGPEKENLENLVSVLELNDDVIFLGFRENPYQLMKDARALVLTSKIEGLPMVLLEALSLKTPVVAFNCKSGPSEIIQHRTNGLLVNNQNEHMLTCALDALLEDELYHKLKTNTTVGLSAFSEDTIMQQWEDLFKTIDK